MKQKYIKYVYFSCSTFLGAFILVFPFRGNVVLLFRVNVVFFFISFSKTENTQNVPTISTFHD